MYFFYRNSTGVPIFDLIFGGPKKVVAEVSLAVGGILSASDACSLPRNEQQVRYKTTSEERNL